MKAILDRHSLKALMFAIFLFATHGAWLMKTVERNICVNSPETREQWDIVAYEWSICGQHHTGTYENFVDAFWCAVVTMTTVGYGDMSPVTVLGRVFSIYLSFMGIVILSLLVNVMTDLTTFRPRERKAFDLINRGVFRGRTRVLAARLLQSFWRLHRATVEQNRIKTRMMKNSYFRVYRQWKTNVRLMLVNENKIDEVAVLTKELSSLRRDFKVMMFTSIVDLEERMDRRMERLAWLIQHNQKEVVGHLSSRHLEHAPLSKVVTGISEEDVQKSIEMAEHGRGTLDMQSGVKGGKGE